MAKGRVDHFARLDVMPQRALAKHLLNEFNLVVPPKTSRKDTVALALAAYNTGGYVLPGTPGAESQAPKRRLIPKETVGPNALPTEAGSNVPDESQDAPHPRYEDWPKLPLGQEYRVVIEVHPSGDKNAHPWISPGCNGRYCQILREKRVAIRPEFLEVMQRAVHGEQVVETGQEAGESRTFRPARDFHFQIYGDVVWDKRGKRILEWVNQLDGGAVAQLPKPYESHLEKSA